MRSKSRHSAWLHAQEATRLDDFQSIVKRVMGPMGSSLCRMAQVFQLYASGYSKGRFVTCQRARVA